MKTTLELLRERLLKDKEIFPHYNEYINGILYDIDNELLAMEKEQIIEFTNDYVLTQCNASFEGNVSAELSAEEYYELIFKSE